MVHPKLLSLRSAVKPDSQSVVNFDLLIQKATKIDQKVININRRTINLSTNMNVGSDFKEVNFSLKEENNDFW